MPYDIQKDFLDPADKVIGENSIKETTITQENLERIWTALEYTRATLQYGYDWMSMQGKIDYSLIHKGRAHQSLAYLEQALKIINQMKGELQ